MNTWIALFRGINVGGRNKMPMAQLRAVLESIGCENVRTYIQSGNVVFSSKSRSKKSLEKRLREATEQEFGFASDVLLLTAAEFRSAISTNPFANLDFVPKTIHFFFLRTNPKSPDMDDLAGIAIATERYALIGSVFYLYAPDGFGRSKLAARAEKKLGVATTARNHATVQKIANMLNEDDRDSL